MDTVPAATDGSATAHVSAPRATGWQTAALLALVVLLIHATGTDLAALRLVLAPATSSTPRRVVASFALVHPMPPAPAMVPAVVRRKDSVTVLQTLLTASGKQPPTAAPA